MDNSDSITFTQAHSYLLIPFIELVSKDGLIEKLEFSRKKSGEEHYFLIKIHRKKGREYYEDFRSERELRAYLVHRGIEISKINVSRNQTERKYIAGGKVSETENILVEFF